MDMSGLHTAEIEAVEAELDAAHEKADAAQKEVRAIYNTLRAAKDDWWAKNLSEFNLDDAEDFMVVAEAGWDNGSSNDLISNYLESWVEDKDASFSRYGWWESREDKGIFLPCVQITMSCDATPEDVDRTATAVSQLSATVSQIVSDYQFRVMSNNASYDGGTCVLNVDGDNASIEVGDWHGQTVFAGTVRECVQYLVQNQSYCSHSEHQPEDRYDWQ